MLWLGIGGTLLAAIVVRAVIRVRRPTSDLGSVSNHWVAEQYRVESP